MSYAHAQTQQTPPFAGARRFHTIIGTLPSALPTGASRTHVLPAAAMPDNKNQVNHSRRAATAPAEDTPRSVLYTNVMRAQPTLFLGARSVMPRPGLYRNDIGRYVARGASGRVDSSQKIPDALVLHTKPVAPRFQV